MKKFVIAATMVALFAGFNANMFAQDGNGVGDPVPVSKIRIKVGVVIVCQISIGVANVQFADQVLEGAGDASGSADFESVAELPNGTEFKANALTISGTDPTYGEYSFSLDPDRAATNTTVEANQDGADFPATANVYANVTGTVAAFPRSTFTNSNECHIRSTNLQSFNPHVGESYEFVEDLVLVDEAGNEITIAAGSEVILN